MTQLPEDQITWPRFIVTYLTVLVSVIGAALIGDRYLSIHGYRTICAGIGVVHLLAGFRASNSLYVATRYMRALGLVQDDAAARVITIVIGLALLGVAVIARDVTFEALEEHRAARYR